MYYETRSSHYRYIYIVIYDNLGIFYSSSIPDPVYTKERAFLFSGSNTLDFGCEAIVSFLGLAILDHHVKSSRCSFVSGKFRTKLTL